ncbi:TonB-dependent siderophore receptor [Acetobacter estunensis]|uniref:TonB-dependent receptor plug domain-containing protein n=1 Tax=Acetobacter estunensis TaxID=104097 RepID=UPI001C2DAD6A|nr:TonB-dependent receptor [Acetobacter estunensis]MBV1837599.1 TonB-dependent receptor [Acetobacter estunensis]
MKHTVLALGAVSLASLASSAQAATTSSSTDTITRERSAHIHPLPAKPNAHPSHPSPAKSRNAGTDAAEEIHVSTGHSYKRTARDSPTPVTVISSAELRRSGQLNLADAIARLDPSITTQAQGWDAGALTSSIRMRGLNPNEVLVLMDGKRRHTTGNIVADRGPQQGSTSVDLNMIPASAIDHIKVLRDGAGARYGADAVAGVINIVTKKAAQGLNVVTDTGADAYNGDGWRYRVGADGGLKWGNNGFVHLSGEVYHKDFFISKSRATRDHRWAPGDAWSPYADHSTSTPEETRENLSIEWGKGITQQIETYGLITYTHRHAETEQHYRLPSIAPSVYPAGFAPIETMEENDFQANLGVRGHNLFGFDWDLSTLYGEDDNDLGVNNTINTNMLASTGWSPTHVRAATYRTSQWTSNFDAHRDFNIAHVLPVTFSFGAEHRLEMYSIKAGEPASYIDGGTAAMAGLTSQSAGSWDRNVWSGYLDGNFHPLKNWQVDLGGRFEHYTDSGSAETGKVSTRYDVTKRIAVRVTISNGFRAPTLAESHYSSLNVSPTGAAALLSATDPAAQKIGASRLKAERSTNVEGGFILEPVDNFHVSVDVYQINIRNRIIGANYTGGQAAYDAIAQTGITLPSGLNLSDVQANYLANVGSTRTQGLDIQADYRLRLHRYGTLDLSLMLNLNRTRMHHTNTNAFGQSLSSAQTASYLTNASPRSKIILNAYWTNGEWDVNIRETRYGQTSSMLTYYDLAPANLQYSTTHFAAFVNTPIWLTDLEVGYRVNPHWHIAVGANNIFNMRPRKVKPANNYLGSSIYDSQAANIGYEGAYYYGRVNATF